MKSKFMSQLLGGMLLIGLGALFLLRQLGYTDFSVGDLFADYWPLFLIWLGVSQLSEARSKSGSLFGGLLFTAMGVFFLGRNLDWFDFSAGDFFKLLFPVLLILGGLSVIFKPRQSHTPPPPPPPEPPVPPQPFSRDADPLDVPAPSPLESTLDEEFERKFGKPAGKTEPTGYMASGVAEEQRETAEGIGRFHSHAEKHWQDNRERHERRRQEREERHSHRHGEWHGEFRQEYGSSETLNRSAFIGDVHIGREPFQLKHTNISQFIGDTVLDLTSAQIPYGETKINISAFVGDIKVYIPEDMDLAVSVNGSSFIGDMQVLDQSRSGFMGSVQCKTPYYKEAGKKVRINVSAFIGDIKVKSVG
ncbi:cell wall-active antibiotics response protein LiaF [Paenibacillus tengchongensis]|uniref:cell wall-active antibiotics response protein LiaF n=1 Tax=Paenibacillus tengchongensis TaxID=2608684 RepID=UPI00124D294C|nr:cell wall-active antibiotics response protein LiaF [Paenibacillus tengchongensis]